MLLDLRDLATFTDFFVVCSAGSGRQISAIAKALQAELDRLGVNLHHREGVDESGWVLLDFGDMVVHVFSPEQRAHYDLEGAWSRAPALVRVP